MVKAIFLDIDGTLVSFKTHKIADSTIESLMKAKEKGIKIFIATGRPTEFINNLSQLQERDLIDGYITMNGSYCYVGSEVIYKSTVPTEEAKTIADFCESKDYSCVYISDAGVSVRKPGEVLRKIFYEVLKVEEIAEKDLYTILSEDIYQLSPFYREEEGAEIEGKIPNCEIGRWTPEFADIGAKGNTKALGIDKMIEHFGIDLSETMAFGDGGNDMDMLSHVALGVAMGNASEKVQKVANYVTTSVDDDGIANALTHFEVI